MPYLIKKQFSKTNKVIQSIPEEETPNSKNDHQDKKSIEDYITKDDLKNQTHHLSSWNDHIGDMKDAYRKRYLKCFAYVMDGGTCIRANTMQAYCELNHKISNLLPTLSHNQLAIPMHPNANIQPKAQVSKRVTYKSKNASLNHIFKILIRRQNLIQYKNQIKNHKYESKKLL